MNYEPLLDERSKNEIIEENIKKKESIVIEQKEENPIKGYGQYDVFHSANIFSKIFFCWVNGVLSLVKKNPLKGENLGIIDKRHSSANFSSQLGSIWFGKRYCDIANNALTKTIFRYYLSSIITLIFCAVFLAALELLCVAMLESLIKYFDQGLNDLNHLIKISVFLIIGKTLSIFLYRQYSIFESKIAMESVLKLNCFIFNKILKASPASNQKKSSQGEIINFIQVDSPKLGNMLRYCPLILIYPMLIVVYIVILFYFLGFSFLFGMIPLVIFMIINYFMYRTYADTENNILLRKDQRMKITTETFDALKLLKMYAWEDEFRKRIIDARDEELVYQKKILNLDVIGITLYWTAPVIVTITTIGVYQYLNPVLDIDRILIGLYVFGLLQDPLRELPYCITAFIDTLVSMKRIEKFLKEQEINDEYLTSEKESEYAIKIDNLSFTWGKVIEEEKKEEENKEADKGDNKEFEKSTKKQNKKKTKVWDKEKSNNEKKLNSNKALTDPDMTLNTIKQPNNCDANDTFNNSIFINNEIDNANPITFPNNLNKKLNNQKNLISTKDTEEKIETDKYLLLSEPKEEKIISESSSELKEEEAKSTINPVLKNISLDIKKGEFIGIIGEVGSGKSSLIQAIMNNLLLIQEEIDSNSENENSNLKEYDNKKSSNKRNQQKEQTKKIMVNGNIAYTSQIPWIQNETLKNNILFFKEFEEKRYQDTIEVSQLKHDIDILPGKDQTEIGEKGINLSGGQKARVSLARAVYADRDIYLFDDPISALDADVGKKVFAQCLLGYLKNKTRVLATHNIQYLKFFDRIVWMDKGRIIFNGRMDELEKQEFYVSFTKNLNLTKQNSNNSSVSNDKNANNIQIKNFINEDNLMNTNKISIDDQNYFDIKYKNNEDKGFNEVENENIECNSDVINCKKSEFQPLDENDLKQQKSSFIVDEIIEEMENEEKITQTNKLKPTNVKSYEDIAVTNKREILEPVQKEITRNLNLIGDHDQLSNSNQEGENLNNATVTIKNKSDDSEINRNNQNNNNNVVKNDNQPIEIHRITKDEDQEVGEVRFSVFLSYFEYMGGKGLMFLIFLIMLTWQALKAYSDIFLANWTKLKDQAQSEKWIYFGIFAGFSLGSCIFIYFRLYFLVRGSLRIAKNLHQDMVNNLIKAPINLFHDSTPKGRIFNRLSKDLENIDYTMFNVGSLLVSLFTCIGALVICAMYEIYTLAYVPILFILGIIVYRYYIKTSRDLQRLEGVSRSPMLNIISEVIPGAMSVRVFKIEAAYKNKFYKKVDDNMKVNIFINGCACWFGLYVDILAIFFLIGLIAFVILFREKFDPQSIGLLITYSLRLQTEIFYLLMRFATFENNMVSMERCLKFTDVPLEKPNEREIDLLLEDPDEAEIKAIGPVSAHTQEVNLNLGLIKNEIETTAIIKEVKEKENQDLYLDSNHRRTWPSNGIIEFKNYSVKYRPETPIVLRDLSFLINSKEKVGIVGRTGSGKSTICNSLFRIIEPFQGNIFIDGVDIAQIGLKKLRKNITIIPQDPCILKGTLKYNVDPLNKFVDEQIEKVLKMVGFNFSADENGIYKEIGDQGDNLSVGEKQLICIARAILRKSKIIVMDEATANIDYQTEENIQKSLHDLLKESTIITIAHRIKTILSYDKILVLENGKIVEYDTPKNLLSDKNSFFYKLNHSPHAH